MGFDERQRAEARAAVGPLGLRRSDAFRPVHSPGRTVAMMLASLGETLWPGVSPYFVQRGGTGPPPPEEAIGRGGSARRRLELVLD